MLSVMTFWGLKDKVIFRHKTGNETRVPLSASILAAQLIRSLLSGREHGLVDPLALPAIGCRAPAGFAGEDPALLPGSAVLTVKQGESPATQHHPA